MLRPVVALLLVFTALAVPAQAQNVVEPIFVIRGVTVDGNPVAPDTGVAVAEVVWAYVFPTTGSQALGAAQGEAVLVWDPPKCDRPGVVISGKLSEAITLQATQSSYEDTSRFDVRVTQDAPGETPIACTFSGHVQGMTGVAETDTHSLKAVVISRFSGLVSAAAPHRIAAGAPGTNVTFAFEVTNLGNARTNLLFRIVDPLAEGWQASPPTQVVLESLQQGGADTSKTIGLVAVAAPGAAPETAIVLEVTPQSTKDPQEQGAPVRLTFLARTDAAAVGASAQGKDAPAAGLAFGLAALGLALARRRA